MEIWLALIGGFVLLVAGGELLVRGAVQVASRLGVSPLVIGLTLVGFGTSAPELVTSVQAAINGSPGIAYGNVVGSNIANLLLILGTSALLTPIMVASMALKRDGAVMLVVTLLFAGLAATMPMNQVIGAGFLVLLASYIYFAFRQESQPSAATNHGAAYEKGAAAQSVDAGLTPKPSVGSIVLPILIAIVGLGLVVAGGYFLVNGAVALARLWGISETVIGLTIVAVGTSLPELVTSIMAAIRKQTDVALGNIIGSNIYNTLGIAGTTALISPSVVPREIVTSDNLVMIVASVVVIALAYTGRKIARWEGLLLLAGYIGYLVWLWP